MQLKLIIWQTIMSFWKFPEKFGVIVIGAGHAGCEAAFAAARMGVPTLILTTSLDTIGKMSCNPAVGGVAKGHIVREIDALGGEMGKITDATGIQFRMLNASKGPAVWAPRAQCDRIRYQFEMKRRLELCPNLYIKQGTVESLLLEKGVVAGVNTKEGITYVGQTVIISSGTFMRGLIHIGETQFSGGRAGDPPSVGLSAHLIECGLELGRLKTGTPPRIHRRSIDFSLTEEQPGDDGVKFSYDPPEGPGLPQVSCYITYTTEDTKKIILDNLHRSPLYSGKIKSVGPRYCPSIEDKIVRFADKERHQIFLEPEGLDTQEIYVNGVSSSLPFDVQLAFIHSIPSLRHAEITRSAYAIEYDYVLSGQLDNSLECRKIPGLFLAGQVNGTTGYEEAAGQGLIAGINAACRVLERDPFVLRRSDAYIGVMIDDLVTKGLDEPYRMFTSRAEHRLLLRQDNADLRLRYAGYKLGLIDEARYQKLVHKENAMQQEIKRLQNSYVTVNGKGYSLSQLLCRPEESFQKLLQEYPDKMIDHGEEINQQIEIHCKYEGYIGRQNQEVAKQSHWENINVPPGIDYFSIEGLRHEARVKLSKGQPSTLAQASRLSGVSPADITVLMIFITRKYSKKDAVHATDY